MTEQLRILIDKMCRSVNWEFRSCYGEDALSYTQLINFFSKLDNFKIGAYSEDTTK